MNLDFPTIAIDTETTGLYPYCGDKLFLISIATPETEYVLYSSEFIPSNNINSFPRNILMQKAKFDMAFLEKVGIAFPNAKIIDVMILGRLADNTRFSLGLDSMAKDYLGQEKLDDVKIYLAKNKLFSMRHKGGVKKTEKIWHYDRVPREIMTPYAAKDARLTYDLGFTLLNKIEKCQAPVLRNEISLTRVLYDMEKTGILVDVAFVYEAIAQISNGISKLVHNFREVSGLEFQDGRTVLTKAFTAQGVTLDYTEKGNPTFDAKALKKMDGELPRIVSNLRDLNKRKTSFEGLLFYLGSDNALHPDIRQCGTVTGRMSVSEPAMQCMEKVEDPEEGDILIRRAFIPRQDYYYFMLDYDQFEYRMMLNYAKEMPLIEMVLAGTDVHQATADLCNISRKQAKAINFGLLYGMGIQELANTLKMSVSEARDTKEYYFSKLPKVAQLIRQLIKTAEHRGYITNWLGRKYIFDHKTAYRAPNYLIQGGTADYIKIAMINIHKFLQGKRSRMLMQIHDELLFEIHKDELEVVPTIRNLMQDIGMDAPCRLLPYTCGVDYSKTNWQDKQEWKI